MSWCQCVAFIEVVKAGASGEMWPMRSSLLLRTLEKPRGEPENAAADHLATILKVENVNTHIGYLSTSTLDCPASKFEKLQKSGLSKFRSSRAVCETLSLLFLYSDAVTLFVNLPQPSTASSDKAD